MENRIGGGGLLSISAFFSLFFFLHSVLFSIVVFLLFHACALGRFVIGNEKESISLPKNKGLRISVMEERTARLEKAEKGDKPAKDKKKK